MDSNIPIELTGPVPRKVRATTSGVYLSLVTFAFLSIAAACALWGALNTAREMQHRTALRRSGAITSGKITRIRRGKNSDVVFYTFTVNEAFFMGQAELPWQLSGTLRESSQLPIRYLPTKPLVNHPADWEWSLFYWLPLSTDVIHLPSFSSELNWLFVPLMFGPISILFLFALRSERRLLTEGVPTTGAVTNCSRGTRGSFSVEYTFRTRDGASAKGRSSGAKKEIGARLCILYLPQDPRRNQPYPSPNFRVIGEAR